MTTLHLQGDELLFFIDDAGDDRFADPGNRLFALAGCAVHARDLTAHVHVPWTAVRHALGGSPTARLHATKVERRLSPRKQAALIDYFTRFPVGRIAAVASFATRYSGLDNLPDHVVRTTAATLLQRVADIAKWNSARKIVGIFEASSRLVPKLEAALQGLGLAVDGVPLQLEWMVMPKSAAEPALEVADFIAHAAVGYIRTGRDSGKFALRAEAIFKPSDIRIASFMEISAVEANPNPPQRAPGSRRWIEFHRGSTRGVLLLGSIAIKVPRLHAPLRGAWCNRKERRIHGEGHPALCPIICADPIGIFVVMRRVEPMSQEYFDSHVLDLMHLIDRPNRRDHLPVEMKASSFGWLDGRIVAIDYAELEVSEREMAAALERERTRR